MRSTDTTDATKGCFQEFPIEQPSLEKSEKEGQIMSVASEYVRPCQGQAGAGAIDPNDPRFTSKLLEVNLEGNAYAYVKKLRQ